MGHFVEGADRDQASFPLARLEDYVSPDHPVCVIDAFLDELDVAELGFARIQPAAIGRPGYAPGTMLKLYIYVYQHQLTSSRKLEREAVRNIVFIRVVDRGSFSQAARDLGVGQPTDRAYDGIAVFLVAPRFLAQPETQHRHAEHYQVDCRNRRHGTAGKQRC